MASYVRQPSYAGAYGLQAAQNLSQFRDGILSKVVKGFVDMEVLDAQKSVSRYDLFPPPIHCPPHQPLTRYGGKEDGGKWVCKLPTAGPCLVYSMGSNGDFTFEADLLNRTSCDVHTFDCTCDGASLDGGKRHAYHKLCIGDKPGDASFRAFGAVVDELGHRGRRLSLLKIDIEGWEFQALSALRSGEPWLPQQVAAELHFTGAGGRWLTVGAKNVHQMSLLFAHLASLGYAAFSREDTGPSPRYPLGDPHCCSEYGFLHVERTARAKHAPAQLQR